MPFTLAHPAAVVHLARGRLSLSGLVVGSMAPDFEYILRGRAVGEIGHTLPGLFVFCVPVGLLAYVCFQYLVKPAVIALLPSFARSRMGRVSAPVPLLPPSRLFAVVLALFVGALTHLAWDSVTHGDGLVVTHTPGLQSVLFTVSGGRIEFYEVLQHASTLLGLALLAFWSYRWLRREPAGSDVMPYLSETLRRRVWITVAIFTLAASLVSAVQVSSPHEDFRAVQVFLVQAAVAGMAALGASLLAFGVWFELLRPRRGSGIRGREHLRCHNWPLTEHGEEFLRMTGEEARGVGGERPGPEGQGEADEINWACTVCGYRVEGELPETCPDCGSARENFEIVPIPGY